MGCIAGSGFKTLVTGDAGRLSSLAFFEFLHKERLPHERATHGYEIGISFPHPLPAKVLRSENVCDRLCVSVAD